MSKISEQKALVVYPMVNPPYSNSDEPKLNVENAYRREGYIKGYDQAMQDFLEEACEWLKDNSKKYVVCYEDGYSHYAYNSMIDDFKNHMQNEEM